MSRAPRPTDQDGRRRAPGEEARRFMRRDRWREGLLWLERAAERDPLDAEARAHLGFFRVKESRYDVRRGLADFAAALELDPACSIARLYRAVTLAYLKDPAAALREVAAAEEAGAPEADAVWAKGCVELEAGSAEKAAGWFRRLAELRPESGSFIMLAKSRYQAGRLEEALDWLAKGRTADPEDFRVPVYQGIYLAFLKRFAEAREALARAEAMTKDYALLQHTWAYVDRAEGRDAEAERRLRAALDMDPDYVTSRKMLGDICAGTGRLDEARTHYRAALALFPDYPEAREALARLEGRP